MNNNTVVAINKDFEISEVGESLIILEPNFEEVFVMNSVEIDIWNLIDGVSTIDDIIKNIGNMYDGDSIENDVTEFFQSLLDKKIVNCIES